MTTLTSAAEKLLRSIAANDHGAGVRFTYFSHGRYHHPRDTAVYARGTFRALAEAGHIDHARIDTAPVKVTEAGRTHLRVLDQARAAKPKHAPSATSPQALALLRAIAAAPQPTTLWDTGRRDRLRLGLTGATVARLALYQALHEAGLITLDLGPAMARVVSVTTAGLVELRKHIPALTIRHPWAFAVAEGFKPRENRPKPLAYRGPLYLHAGLTIEQHVHLASYSHAAALHLDELGGRNNFWNARTQVPSQFHQPHPTLALGAIIAIAEVTGSHPAQDGCCAPWGQPGVHHWELANVRALTTAIPAKGSLGLWQPDIEVREAVERQLAEPNR